MATRRVKKIPCVCHGCQQRIFIKPFVHQKCQHIVCARCSYKNKNELECIRCRSNDPGGFARQAVSNGYCDQLDELLQNMYADSYQKQSEQLFTESPGAYAESNMQRTHLVTPWSVAPNPDALMQMLTKKKKKKKGCCYYTRCGCCVDPIVSAIWGFLRPILYGIIILWLIWAANNYVTGSKDLRNLPVFGWVPHTQSTESTQNPSWANYVPPKVEFGTHKKEL